MTQEYTFIYALKDPTTNEVRYIGKSDNPEARIYHHCATRIGSRKTKWIKSLIERGLRPELIILEECVRDSHRHAETAWIHFFLDLGCDLTNAIYRGYDRGKMLRDAYSR